MINDSKLSKEEPMSISVKEVDKVEILTLQDNYVDLVSRDDNAVVQRAMPLRGLDFANSIRAEHGFSALVTVTDGAEVRKMLFDFGFSEDGAAANAQSLNADMSQVEVLALSHGHLDHTGGLKSLVDLIGRPGLDLVAHPSALRSPRFLKVTDEIKISLRSLQSEAANEAGVNLVLTDEPYALLDGRVWFLGEIPRKSEFEKGMPNAVYMDGDQEKWDPIEDDTALVMNVKGRGLVILSGCAHSGIVNTVKYAREVTGINDVYVVMGGFHLTGPLFEGIIAPTTEALKEVAPSYVIPTHCTGRKAVNYIEKEMPDQFLMNMAGTKLTFAA